MTEATFVPLEDYKEYPVEEMKDRAAAFYEDIRRRRTVREFSDRGGGVGSPPSRATRLRSSGSPSR